MKILNRLIDLIYPPRCPLCGDISGKHGEPCEKCEKCIPVIREPVCRFCGREKYGCGCGHERHIYSGIVSPFYYDGNVKSGIYRLKYNNIKAVNKYFARETVKVILREYPGLKFDLITFVPMHRDDLKKRQYNPAQTLAEEIGGLLGTVTENCLVKLYNTKQQHKLSKKERRGNVLGIFDVAESADVAGKTVLLIDDVTTTGATLDECAKMLMFSGAKSVYCAVAAATGKKDRSQKKDSFVN